jgi:hypothetical protein
MEDQDEVEFEGSPPLSPTLLLLRILNGVLIFLLPLQVAALVLPDIGSYYYAAWALLGHPFVVFCAIVSTKQYRTGLMKLALVFHMIFCIISVPLAISIGVMAHETPKALNVRVGVPLVSFVALLHFLAFLASWQVLREPVRPRTMTEEEKSANGQYHFAIASDEVGEELADIEDGLGLDPAFAGGLHAASSSPTGLARYMPTILQILSIVPAFLWPVYFLDVIIALGFPAQRYNIEFSIFLCTTITYHYSMLLWIVGSVTVSVGFKNRRRLFVASLAGFCYLVACIVMAAIKFALWHSEYISPILTAIHLCFLAPWCAGAYYLSTNRYDYNHVPSCCGSKPRNRR